MNTTPPRTPLGVFPTPLHRCDALAEVLGIDDFWIKRDDLTGFSWGGNKVRAAEFLLADALAEGATELVVSGSPGSNFVPIMTAAGRTQGVRVHRVTSGDEPRDPAAAFRAASLYGASVTFTESRDRNLMDSRGRQIAKDREMFGQQAYLIPRGGATPVGALGFFAAAKELSAQLKDADIEAATLVVPVGSGGSIAGLVAGAAASEAAWTVVGVSVSRPPSEIHHSLAAKAVHCAALMGATITVDDAAGRLILHDAQEPGFGVPLPEAIELAHRIEAATGLFIDPTYNAKTLHWLMNNRSLLPTADGPVIYWHTGGALAAVDALRSVKAKTK